MTEKDDLPAILKIGDTKLVLTNAAAMRVMQSLLAEDVREMKQEYKKNPTSGEYRYEYSIVALDFERLSLCYMSPINYLAYVAAGEKE